MSPRRRRCSILDDELTRKVRPWAKSIKEKVANRRCLPGMPIRILSDFKNNGTLSQAEIDTIVAWVDGGANEGNPKDLPPVPTFEAGLNIGKPDMIIQIPEEYTYKPGVDEYQYFDVPTNPLRKIATFNWLKHVPPIARLFITSSPLSFRRVRQQCLERRNNARR